MCNDDTMMMTLMMVVTGLQCTVMLMILMVMVMMVMMVDTGLQYNCVTLQCGIRVGAIICGGAKEDAINAIARALHSARVHSSILQANE